jgi:aldehyde dehydrogenase (NAD+)
LEILFVYLVVLELGGKSPAIIDSDCDLAIAAKRTIWGKLINCGQVSFCINICLNLHNFQVCVTPDYAIVIGNNERRDQFTAECSKSIIDFYGTDPINNEDYGRIINQRQFDRLEKLLKTTNGKIIHGGKTDKDQLFISPTVIEVDETDPTMENEIFGPILPVLQFPSLNDAIKLVKKRNKPLIAYLFSDSKKTVERVQNDISSGTLTINDTIMNMSLDTLPFGGVGHRWVSFNFSSKIIYI